MRLICPNCDAQYDIADDVIPEGGREVQCSSCTHTWFQTDKPKVAGRSRAILTPTPSPAPKTPAPQADAPGEDAESPAPPAPKRKPLDSSIADILREEAAREHDVAKPAATPEAKADAQRADETRRRIAQMTEESAASTPASVAAAATGAIANGNLRTVPGIDEINATLRARAEASDNSGLTESEKEEAVQRRGFRRGFAIVLILIALAIAPYFFAQEIVESLPQTRDFMVQYIDTVNQLREQLRDLAGQASAMIENLMPSDAAAPAETAPADVVPAAPETAAPQN